MHHFAPCVDLEDSTPLNFNDLLLRLYALSQQQPIDTFQDAALQLVKPLLPFDAAVWGTASTKPTGIDIHTLHLHHKTPDMVAAYEEVKHLDTAAASMFSAGKLTRAFHTDTFFEAADKQPVRHFMARFEQPNFLISSDCNPRTSLMHWLTLYRADRNAHCTPADVNLLEQLAPHLMQALAFNRTAHLGRLAAAEQALCPNGMAVADCRGVLYATNAQFVTAVRKAWGISADIGACLPEKVMTLIKLHTAHPQSSFEWLQMVLTCHEAHGLVFIKSRAMQAVDRLTERERAVAALIAAGHTHKEVAQLLCRSPATVRNQIAQIYGKLNINCVAELIRALSFR